jgi:hypothetical protein
MRDLFVLAADADMKAVFEAILRRPEALGIRPINSFVDKHPWRDRGVFSEGPEFIRRTIPKNDYRRFILALDHHGSGCNKLPEDVPMHFKREWIHARSQTARSLPCSIRSWKSGSGTIRRRFPTASKPVRFSVRKKDCGRSSSASPSRGDFEQIATHADLDAWNSSASFRILKETLQNWFPRT